MANLTTKYLGLELRNPVIAGASNLTLDPDNLRRMEEAGAAAIVFKSLFEEQIQLENLEHYERLKEYEERNAEMITLYPDSKGETSYSKEHLYRLRKARESVKIPLIASLNAVNQDTWVEYAVKLEETGVDALELNFYTVPEKPGHDCEEIERNQIKTMKAVKAAVKIPVAIKLSPFYSNPVKLISGLEKAGASGFVLFNRLFQPDIDINKEIHVFPDNLSSHSDSRLPLRFAGLLYGYTRASVCTSSGIMSGSDVVKMILAGADCVQVVSALYMHKIEVISNIVREINEWMDGRGYGSTGDFRGKLSVIKAETKVPYRRAQYFDFQMSTSAIMRKYKSIR
jgi:dihydroorotate dehydrogenase (fumarate)